MIKSFLVPGSILELAMRRCVIGKDTSLLFPNGAKQSPVVVAQPDERLETRTQKRALCWCGKADAACLVHTNERTGK